MSKRSTKNVLPPSGRLRTSKSRSMKSASSSLSRASAPAAMGLQVNRRSSFGFAGPAQRLADQDSGGSLRVMGRDLFGVNVASGASGAGGFASSSIGPFYAAISPSTISPRLAAVEEMFQWYVFRRISVVYTPVIGTSTQGALHLGYSTDWQLQSAIASPTGQQAMELNPALMTPVWQLAEMDIKNTGTKLFECYLSSEAGDERFQGLLCAVLSIPAASTTFGQLYIEFVVDFYQPTPLLSSVDRERRRARQARHVPCLQALLSPAVPARPPSEGKEEKVDDPLPPDSPILVRMPRYTAERAAPDTAGRAPSSSSSATPSPLRK